MDLAQRENFLSRAASSTKKADLANLLRGSEHSIKEVAEELGIPAATLGGWNKEEEQLGAESFPGKGYVKDSDKEIMALRKALAIAQEERDILKKALGIFSLTKK